MTLILKLDLDNVKMYHHTKNEVSMSTPSKVIVQIGRQTDRQTDTHTMKTLPLPHTWEVIKIFSGSLANRSVFAKFMMIALT